MDKLKIISLQMILTRQDSEQWIFLIYLFVAIGYI